MPIVSIPNVRLAGIAASVPPLEEVSWSEIPDPDRFKVRRSRGEIPFRRMARVEQCQSDFCVEAAKSLLTELGWHPSEIELVIMVTLTPDYPIPATAIIVQDRLGIPKTAAAFDLASGALGFLHGLQIAASMLSSGYLKKALLLTGEVSKTLELSDNSTPYQAIYGHSGSVCALEYVKGEVPMFFDTGGDGADLEAFYMPVGGVRNPPRAEMFNESQGIRYASDYIIDVARISARALKELPPSIERVLATAGLMLSEFDACFITSLPLPVQSALRTKLSLTVDRLNSTSYEYGWSGSGTIPLAMIARSGSLLRAGRYTSLFSGIGPGLAWGSAIVTTDKISCPPILEL